jgi:hypothetical protein
MIRGRLPKVTLALVGLAVLLAAVLLFLLGLGLYGTGEEKPMSRSDIQQAP